MRRFEQSVAQGLRSFRAGVALLCLAAGAGELQAASPHPYSVGNDPSCDFETIQEAINAAAANPGPDVIAVAYNRSYSAQALSIGQQDLIIEGGWLECYYAEFGGTPPTQGVQTTISGAGGSAAPVISITGSGVREFHNLFITGGDNGGSDGGGIRFNGIGAVVLDDTVVGNNVANRGGGVYMHGGSGATVLELKANALIINNRSNSDGGGLHVSGSTRLRMLEPNTTVFFNRSANGRGGGLFIRGPAYAEIQSAGLNGLAVIDSNSAVHGGGIAAIANDVHGEYVEVDMVGALPPQVVRIANNVATERGGAFYALGDGDTLPSHFARAYLHLDNIVIDGNHAADGAAIYLDGDEFNFGTSATGGEATFGRHHGGARSLRCKSKSANAQSCNVIERNETHAAGGAIIHVQSDFDFSLAGSVMRENRAVHLFRVAGMESEADNAVVELADCLIAVNILDEPLLRASGPDDRVKLGGCTVAQNDILNSDVVFRMDQSSARFEMTESIVDQPLDTRTITHPGWPTSPNIVSASNLGASHLSNGDTTSIVAAAPRFVDVQYADFRLRPGSQAVDLAASVEGDQFDLDAQPGSLRDQEQPLTSNRGGTRDAGAYELAGGVNLVANASFAGDLRAWDARDIPTGVIKRFVAESHDASSGSAEVLLPAGVAGNEAVALSHCAHVPVGAGNRFELSARAFTGEGDPATQDFAIIEWFYRRDSDEQCAGQAVASGELVFPRGAWTTAATEIIAAGAHANSTIELRLKVRRNAGEDPTTSQIFARFDAIMLRPGLFRDSFEHP